MKSSLKNICIVVERNIKIEKIVYDCFRDLEAKASKEFLESQIINWSYFDVNDHFEEVFFKVYVHRYLNLEAIQKRIEKYKSNDLCALVVIHINEEDKSDVKSIIDLSFHDDQDDLNIEVAKVHFMSFIRRANRNQERSSSYQLNV